MTQQVPEGFVFEESDTGSGQAPEGFVFESRAEPREDTPPALQEQKGFFESFSEWMTGSGRNTQSLDQLPSIIDNGFLAGENIADVAKVAMLTSLTNDPNELANIIQKQIPNIRIQYDKDAEGNIYPVLINPNNGQIAAVDKPGADIMNIGQFITQGAAFFGGGPGKSTGIKALAKVGGQEAAKETALQVTQAVSGGDVDAGDIAAAGVIGGGFQGVGELFKTAFMASKGVVDEGVSSVVSAAKDLNIPVLSSDIYNPRNWFTRGAQIASESLPIVGTGSLRVAQQDARQQALDDFVTLYRGGTYEEIIESIGFKNKALKDAAGTVYNKVNPFLDQLSADGGIPLPRSTAKLDEVYSQLTRPGLDVNENALNILDDLDEAFQGGNQSFQVVKDNIGAWTERIDSIDPGATVNSNEKRLLKQVLRSLREDRDAFAQSNLNDVDYAALKQADEAWGEMVQEMSTDKMKLILNKGDVTPEVARNMLFSRNKSDISRLYASLTPKGQSSARAAFISQISEDLNKQAKGLSPTSFATAINKYSDGVEVLFPGEKGDELNGLIKVFEATKRAQEVERGSGSQTFERLFGVAAVAGGAGGAIPLEALGAYASLGGMARLFESPRIRSILTKINGVNPASDEARLLAGQFNRLLAASLQANPLKGTTEYERELSEELRSQQNQPVGVQ